MEYRTDRLPPYILGEVTALMQKARREGEDIINLGMGNPDLPTPKHIVEKLIEAARKPKNHRYSVSRGIPKLRKAVTHWYQERFGVELDPDSEAIATMGAKEGLSHLVLALTQPGDLILAPNPAYPIHTYSVTIAGGQVYSIPILPLESFCERLELTLAKLWPKPKLLVLSFPSNPTTQVVDLAFLARIVKVAAEYKLKIIHDIAYADLVFDGYQAPSILQVPGAKKLAVEFYSLSKGYSMPGWRVGFCCGNASMVGALQRIKSYLDYGMFAPIQIAATYAMENSVQCNQEIVEIYRKRRDVLCDGLRRIGWEIEKPLATMFVWAQLPAGYKKSIPFAKKLLKLAKVNVSPGIGFGSEGEGFVRFALVENENRIRQAVRGIKAIL